MISKPSTTLSMQYSKSKDSGLQTDKSSTSVTSRSGRIFKTPIRRFFRLEMLKPSSSSNSNLNTNTAKFSSPEENNLVSQAVLGSTFKELSIRTDTNTPNPSTTIQDPDTINNTKETSHTRSPAEHDSRSRSSEAQTATSSPIACMALQNFDHSVDAIIISTLVKLPFCCHEDLLTMSESRILEVGKEMNERLPSAMRINLDLNNHNSERRVEEVKKEIERLVGIVKKATKEVSVPRAPLKRAKSKGQSQNQVRRQSLSLDQDNASILDRLDFTNISPPTSPLANISQTRRSKRRSGVADITMILTPTKLEMLREEDEGPEVDLDTPDTFLPLEIFASRGGGSDKATAWKNDFASEDIFRAFKKRKTVIQPIDNYHHSQQDRDIEMITPTMREIKSPLKLKNIYYGESVTLQQDVSPTPSHRRGSRIRTQTKSQVDNMLENENAQSLEQEVIIKTTAVTDRSLIHTRPRYRTKSYRATTTRNAKYINDDLDLQPGPLQTSTPKHSRHKRRPEIGAALGKKGQASESAGVNAQDINNFIS